MYVCMYVCMHVCIYVYMYARFRIHVSYGLVFADSEVGTRLVKSRYSLHIIEPG